MSKKPLLLDGRLVPLAGIVEEEGWRQETSLSFWWNRLFNGMLVAHEPGTVLELTFRGSAVGLYYAMDRDFGTFHAGIDGTYTQHVKTNTRGGFSFDIIGMDLPVNEHSLCVMLPKLCAPALHQNGPVKLGYLLLAGEMEASGAGHPL